MKIGIVWAFSTWKTTLAYQLKEKYERVYWDKIHLDINTERELAELLSFDFNKHTEEQKLDYQRWLVHTTLAVAWKYDDLITDTPINLIPAYCDDENIKKIVRKYSPYLYDIIFYLPIEFEIENDWVRHTNEELRRGVNKRVLEELHNAYSQNNKLTIRTLHWSIADRLQQAIYFIDMWKRSWRWIWF